MAKNNDSYRNITSKDGSLTPHLYDPIAQRIRDYCKQQDISISQFVENCVSEKLDVLEKEAVINIPHEMLVEMYLVEKRRNLNYGRQTL